MSDVKQLQQERIELFENVYDGKTPKRIPIEISVVFDAAIDYAGLDAKEVQYDLNGYESFFDPVCAAYPADKMPVTLSSRTPLYPQLLGSKAFRMSETGTMQHPEVSSMEVEEYDELIADPYKFLVNKAVPRLCTEVGGYNDMRSALNFAKAYKASIDNAAKVGMTTGKMCEKYGFAVLPRGPLTEAPYDFLADMLRSFTNVSIDIRRCPEKVIAACEALTPHMCRLGTLPSSGRYGRTFIPLHMAPFMRQKDFEKFWWPSFKALMDYLENSNFGVKCFVEQDWMPKIDFLASLGNRVEFMFEFGDPALAKEKVGKQAIISGFYPVTLLQTGTKQQCVNKAKEMIDILAPGGGYIFNFDKNIYSVKGSNGENLRAVIDTVLDYGKY